MAAITPDSLKRESVGSLTLHIANFETTLIDDADTWATGLPNVVGVWGNVSSDESGGTVNVSNSSGTLTFRTNGADNASVIYVLSKT